MPTICIISQLPTIKAIQSLEINTSRVITLSIVYKTMDQILDKSCVTWVFNINFSCQH